MELRTQSFGMRFINGLEKYINRDMPITPKERVEWLHTKEKCVRIFTPERGGSYQIFNKRSLTEAVNLYYIQDINFLRRLWSHYYRSITAQKREKVRPDFTGETLLGFRTCGSRVKVCRQPSP